MLSPWQLERQVAHLLELVTWEDAPGDEVLTGGAVVSADGPGNFLPVGPTPDTSGNGLSLPFALVTIRDARAHEDLRGRYREVVLEVTVVAGGGGIAGATGDTDSNDTHGTASTIGGERAVSQGSGKSTGRGVDEVSDRILEILGAEGYLTSSSRGFQGAVTRRGAVDHVDAGQVVQRTFEIVAFDAQDAAYYHAPRRMKATVAGSNVTVRLDMPPVRYDAREVVLVRKAGASAPANVTDGTEVETWDATDFGTAVSVTEAPGSGTWSYAAFATYDETGSGTAERTATAVTVTSVVVP